MTYDCAMDLPPRWRPVERELSVEPTTVLHASDACLAFTTESGFVCVSWPVPGGRLNRAESLAEDIGAWRSGTEGWNKSFSLPLALVGGVSLEPHQGASSVVVRHLCPETRRTCLGPWDEDTARALLAALHEGLGPPRALGALLAPTADELRAHPRRYHGALVVVEGRWCPAFEAPSFVAESTLVFPPGVAAPDRPTRLRVEGVWVVTERPGLVTLGGGSAQLRARAVEVLPWASTLAAGARRVLGAPIPERLLALVDRGAWNPEIVDASHLLSATGWARSLDTLLGLDAIEAEMQRIRALDEPARRRLGFAKDAPRCLDEDRALVLARNVDGRMIALDSRRDPPEVMYTEEVRGELRWRRLAGDFEAFAESFLLADDDRHG